MDQKRIGARAYETQLLADRLAKLKPEEIVRYDELGKLCGLDVRPTGSGYSRLMSARRIVEKEAGFLLGIAPAVGVKRLAVDEQAAIAPQSVKKLRRSTGRVFRRMALVEYAKLDANQKAQHNLAASIMGVCQLFTKPKSIEKLSGAVQQAASKLPIGDTLSLFHTSNGNS